jgi:hypothetical protein
MGCMGLSSHRSQQNMGYETFAPNPSINTDAGDKAAGAGYVKR